MCRQAVWNWLVLLTMEKYVDNFLKHGYDCIARCKLIIHSDLVMLGVDNLSHRKLLLRGVQLLNNSLEFTRSEPCELHEEEESIFEGSTSEKYFELHYRFENSLKLDEASLVELPIGSPDRDILSETPEQSQKTIELQETSDSNWFLID